MKNAKGYEQVIEWEYIDKMTVYASEISIALIFFITKLLNEDSRFNNLYKFDVLHHGYIRHYPSTGVQYINNNQTILDEDFIQSEYFETIKNLKIGDLLDFSIENYAEIHEFFKMITEKNEQLFKKLNIDQEEKD